MLPCSLRGDLHSLEAAVRDIDDVYGPTALFGGALQGIGPWRRLDRELAERGAWELAEQMMTDSAATVEAPQSARQRRWADAEEEAGEEAESGAGPPAPLPLQGDAFARAEGFGVTDAPAAADANLISSILNDGEDEWL